MMKITIQSLITQEIVDQINKENATVLSSELLLEQDGESIVSFVVQEDESVLVTGFKAYELTSREQDTVRSKVNNWISFIQREINPVEESTTVVNTSMNGNDNLEIKFDIFMPGIIKLTQAEWQRDTDIMSFKKIPTIILNWENFVCWQTFLSQAGELIKLKRD